MKKQLVIKLILLSNLLVAPSFAQEAEAEEILIEQLIVEPIFKT